MQIRKLLAPLIGRRTTRVGNLWFENEQRAWRRAPIDHAKAIIAVQDVAHACNQYSRHAAAT